MSVQEQLRERIEQAFTPDWLELDNESHMHSVPANSETHFRLVMSSQAFEGMRAVARHQSVYKELADLLAGPIHALAMHLYDPKEWQEKTREAPASPDCLGGSKVEREGMS